ncbi:MAG: IS1634 family transposase, partial [Candidatus Methylomirabilales bacterium]
GHPMRQSVPEVVGVKRLDHLPLVGAVLRYLEVKDTIDQLLPADPRHEVTAGEGVEALVLMILTGEHALYRVSETLAGYDLEVIFQRPIAAEHFHDTRLGHVLDALWEVGLDRVYGAVISHAIHKYALDLSRLHSDTTSLKVYGAYEREEEEEGPLVTFGFSKDHRPDLKQLLFGLTVTADGSVPVWGHVSDGNRSDSEEHRFHITQLRQYLPDLTHPLLGADSKFFAGQTLLLAQEERLSFVTLVPQTVGLQRTLVEEMELEAMPVLLERPGRRSGTVEVSRGRSVLRTYQAQTARGEPQELLLRFLVVESTQLAKHNGPKLAAAIQAERARLSELTAEWERREFACEAMPSRPWPRSFSRRGGATIG